MSEIIGAHGAQRGQKTNSIERLLVIKMDQPEPHICFFETSTQLFLKKTNGPIPASFCLFSSFSRYNFNNTN